MKKLFISILSLSLSFIFLLFAGCGGAGALSFNNSFSGGNSPDSTFKETLTYNVTNGDYNDLVRSSDISKEVADFSTKGTMTVDFEICTKDYEPLQEILNSTDIELDGMIFHLSTKLSLSSVYKVNGNENAENDDIVSEYIESEVYFLPASNSFAPIYSHVKQSYNIMYAGSTEDKLVVKTQKIESEYQTVYRKNEYTITSIGKENTDSKTYDYDFKTIIDNTQLLFALRNVSIEKDGTFTLPTVAPAYGKATNLLVTNKDEVTKTLKINVNGTEIEESLSVKNLSFYVQDNKNTGTPQYVSIQKSASSKNGIPHMAYMTEYAQPLICYGSFTYMGALIFKLSSIK